jgi:AcrR family transcriptional regulator
MPMNQVMAKTDPARKPEAKKPEGSGDARERIIQAAYDLFCRNGVRAVGIDRVIAEAGVAKMTLYRHFASKEDLVVAVLDRRRELWTWGWLDAEVRERADAPRDQLLAIFDAFDEWFRRPDFESCLFISCLLESADRKTLMGKASAEGLADVRALIVPRAKQAGIAHPGAFAQQWQVLMAGAIVLATAGDADVAKRARAAGELLLDGLA